MEFAKSPDEKMYTTAAKRSSPIVQSRAVLCASRRLEFKTSTRMVMANPPSTPISCENAVAVARKFSAPVKEVCDRLPVKEVCERLLFVSVIFVFSHVPGGSTGLDDDETKLTDKSLRAVRPTVGASRFAAPLAHETELTGKSLRAVRSTVGAARFWDFSPCPTLPSAEIFNVTAPQSAARGPVRCWWKCLPPRTASQRSVGPS